MADFCLIGKRLNYSYSALVHTMFGYDYELTEVAPENLADFVKSRKYKGYNVTIPYKSAVLPLLDKVSDTAAELGVVNLVRDEGGKLVGYNMDIKGLEYALQTANMDVCGKKVLILGSGNTSNTAAKLMHDLGAAEVIKISRSGENNYTNVYNHTDAALIVNTTPVGTYPANEDCLLDISRFDNLQCVQEVVYNPFKTRLVLQAESLGLKVATGLDMLVGQAAYSAEMFVGKLPDAALIKKVCNTILFNQCNVCLVGMPACGKTTVGSALAAAMHKKFVDTDAEIEKLCGKTVPEIFATEGEKAFRTYERQVIRALGAEHGQVIATGGGAPLDSANVLNLKQNGIMVHLRRELSSLCTDGRPLSQGEGALAALAAERMPLYKAVADVTADNNGEVETCVKEIKEKVEQAYEHTCD